VLLGGQPGTSVAEDRVAGFRAELEAAGIAWSETLWRQRRPRLQGECRARGLRPSRSRG
jgi:DNA-binding LacI/PurR family transcriptional regulator